MALGATVGAWLVGLAAGQLASRAAAQADGVLSAYASAAELQSQGLYDLAADAWREMLADSPDGKLAPRARYNLGVCRFHSGAFAESAKLFSFIADPKTRPADVDAQLAEAAWANLGLSRLSAARGMLANSKLDPKQAETELRAAIRAFDAGVAEFAEGEQATSNQFHRGEAFGLLGDHEAAAESFRAVIGAQPAAPIAPQASVGLASALLAAGAFDQVEAAVREVVDNRATPLLAAEARLLRGESRLEQQKFAAAADDFKLVAAVPKFDDAAYAAERLAFTRYLIQDYPAAAVAYDDLVQRFAKSPLVKAGRVSAGKCWLLAKKPELAADRLAAAWREDPTAGNLDAARWLGRAQLENQLPAKALATAEQALALKPAAAGPLRLLAADALRRIEGRQAEALQGYEAFAIDFPQDPSAPRAMLAAAQLAIGLQQQERAGRLADWLLDAHQDHPLVDEAKVVAAAAALGRGEWEQAAERYSQLTTLRPDDPRLARWRFRLAEAERGRANPQAAVAVLSVLIENHADSPLLVRALYERGRLLTAAGKLPAANADFNAVIAAEITADRDDSLRAFARLALARNQFSAEQVEQSIVTLQTLLANGPTEVDGQANYLLATAQFSLQQYDAALRALSSAEAPPHELDRLRVLSVVGLQKVAPAQQAVEEFLRQHPNQPAAGELLHELAWLERESGDAKRAIVTFTRVVAQHTASPFAAESSFRAGEIYREQNQHAKAAASFQAAAEIAAQTQPPDRELTEQSLHLLGWSHWSTQQHSQAAEAFGRQLQAAPQGPLAIDGQLMLGESLFAQKKYAEALAAYQAGLAGELTNRELAPLALLHAGQAAGQQGAWQASLKLLERARRWVKETPLADEAAYERAWALHQLGRNAEAAPEFGRLADQADGALAARAAFMRGELHFAEKDYQQAVRMFFRVAYGFGGRKAPQEYHTWQAESLFEAARCLEQLKRVEPALKLYAELVERFPNSPKAKLAQDRLSAVARVGE